MKAWRLWMLGAALAVAGCGDDDGMPDDDGGTDAAMADAGPECVADEDCDDGLFCNGAETCSAGVCVDGSAIACDDDLDCTIDVCDEETDRCVFAAPDADADGVRDATCVDAEGMPLGADCDDDDPNRFPGNPEVCDEDGHDEDCNLETFGAIDRDGDGYFDARCCNPTSDGTGQTCGLDCDDVRPNVNPAATEACDRVDNDCNGNIDEGVLVMGYADADRDGYGDFSMTLESCPGQAGFVPAGGDEDCDDADRTRNPGQVEVCDGEDNDCDTNLDESPQVVDWYRDLDGDGFGNAASGVVRSCTPVAGHVLVGTDCNDAVAAVNPAAAEVCNGLDDDCTGGANYEIAPGDFEDDDGDGVADIGCGLPRGIDCDDFDPITSGGSAEACDGRDNDCDDAIDEGAMDTLWYWDGDLDGHGSPANPDHPVLRACRPQPGYVASGGDCADTDPMRNPDAAETCNARDDDCDAAIDERNVCGCPPGLGDCNMDEVCETSTGSDRNNCGACGNRCTLGPNARSVLCSDGACTTTSCRIGYDDCDGDAANGCETNIFADTANCGACGEVCVATPGTNVDAMRCDTLDCDIASCNPGFDDCNGNVGDGCETDVSSDSFNCGGCGFDCGTDVGGARIPCSSGACQQPCIANETADCDLDPANGCETRIDQPGSCGACGVSCGGGACVRLSTGSFGCETRCAENTADCDGDPGNGCETVVSFTACGCGAPPVDCFDVFGSAATGFCRGNTPGDALCERTGCAGLECFGRCIDVSSDPRNCGGCGVDCGPNACIAGSCDCGALTRCPSGGCVDTSSDPRNCGSCGFDCGPDACIGGVCQTACAPNTGDCDMDPGNGCETSLLSDPANCGACNNNCPDASDPLNNLTASSCLNGNCDLRCRGGFGDCDADRFNGCETALNTDPANCGGCGFGCGAGGACSLGGCDEVVEVALGTEHTCAVRSSGSVVCFGSNDRDQLGIAVPGPITSPALAVSGLPGPAQAVSAGDRHTCAIVRNGALTEVYCWGDDQFGQVGDGAAGGTSNPTRALLPSTFVPEKLALGASHSCVLGTDTTMMLNVVYCWGANSSFQLGNGGVVNSATPVLLATAGGVPVPAIDIAAGLQHTCVIREVTSSITIGCWGANALGQLGDGTAMGRNRATTTTIPATVFGPVHLAAGNDHTCVQWDGGMYCWGNNSSRQVSDSATTSFTMPTPLIPPSGGVLADVAAGLDTVCVRLQNRSVECRGSNAGALDPTGGANLPVWTRIVELGNSVDDLFLDAQARHYAVRAARRIFTWGLTGQGRLGVGPTAAGSEPPTQVDALTP